MPRYEITEWNERYEVDEKGGVWTPGRGKRGGPLKFIRHKVHGRSQGLGWRRLIQVAGVRNAPGIFGIFAKLLEIAGDADSENRGFFDDDPDCPLSFILGLADKDIKNALSVLSAVGWIKRIDEVPENFRKSAEIPNLRGIPNQISPDQFSSNKDMSGETPDGESDESPSASPEEEAFEEARKLYPSTAKRGHATEWENFRKRHKDWRTCVHDLAPAIRLQMHEREQKQKRGEFIPCWQNFQTWINQRTWEQAANVEV